MARKGFFDRLADKFEEDENRLATYGGYDAVIDNKPDQDNKSDDDDTSFKKEEMLKMIEDFLKDDPSLVDEVHKMVDMPRKTEDIVLDFKAKALEDKKLLKKVLQELKEDKVIQRIIDELATPAPAPAPAPVPAPAPAPTLADKLTLPKFHSSALPVAFDPKRYAQEVIFTLREHPEVKDQILDPKTDLNPRSVDVYYDERNDELHENPLLAADIQKIVYARFGGDYEKACGLNGWFSRERRIADRYGNPTKEIFPEGSKGSK